MAESTLSEPDWTHILVETSSLDDVKGALRGSSRLKFTCIDVSSKFLAFGSNTGSVYVFGRSNHKHPQIIFPEIEPAQVNCVSISPIDKSVAFSTVKGHVVVVELSTEKGSRQKPERLRLITDHVQSTVTSITWDTTGSKLYTGDNLGRIYATSIPSTKVQNLVSLPPEIILRLDSPICQVDFSEDKLLVSTLHKCYLCYTSRQKFTHIGTKSREGEYGACFYRQPSTGLYRIYCARPGSRIWEVDIECNVLCTHMFKHLLAIPALPMVSSVDYYWKAPLKENNEPKSVAFPKLKTTRENFLFTWCKTNIYVLDPVNIKVIFWTDMGADIQNIVSSDSYLFIFYCNGNIQKTKIFPIPQCVSILISKKSWILAEEIYSYFYTWIAKMRWKKYVSVEDLEKLKEHCKNSSNETIGSVIDNMVSSYPVQHDSESSGLEDSFSDRSRSSSNASIQKLETGIYRINSQPSLLSPEIRSIPEDFQSSFTGGKNPVLTNLKSEIIGLIDSTTKEVKIEKENLSFKSEDLSFGKETMDSTSNNLSEISCNVTQLPDLTVNGAYNQQREFDILYTREDELDSKKSIIISGEIGIDELENETVLNTALNGQTTVIEENTKPMINGTEGASGIDNSIVVGLQRTNKTYMNEEKETERKSFVNDHTKQQSESRITENCIQETVEDIFAGEDSKPVLAIDVNDVTPLVVSRQTSKQRKKKPRKGSVNTLEDEGKTIPQKGKLQHRQSIEEPLTEECLSQPVEVSHVDTDNKSLGEGSNNSSPSSSLAQSWESSNSEMFGGLRKNVQSMLTTKKNKILQAIKSKKLPRSPGREGRSTPDTLSLDSMDGIIISADKVQKDLVELAPVVKGPIDLSNLQKSTEETRKLLQDVNVLLNPIELQKTLSDWIKHLNQSLYQLHTFLYAERIRKYHTCSKEKNENSQIFDQPNILEQSGEENINNSGIGNSKLNEGHFKVKSAVAISTGSSHSIKSKTFHHLDYLIEEDNLNFGQICYVNDPFLMERDFQQNVAELTEMCFGCGCHGDVSNFTFPSLKDLNDIEICDKCNEVLNVEKFSIYILHQRDSGFSDSGEMKQDSKNSKTETAAGFGYLEKEESGHIKCISNEPLRDIVETEGSKNLDDSSSVQTCPKWTNEKNTTDLNDQSKLECSSLTDKDTINTQEKLEAVLKEEDSFDDLDSLSGPVSNSSDKSILSLSDSIPDSHSLESDKSIESSFVNEKGTEKCVQGKTMAVNEAVVNDNSSSRPFKDTKHHPCYHCHQCHTICFHGKHLKKECLDFQTFVQSYFFLLDIDNIKNKAHCFDEQSYQIWCGLVNALRECCKEDVPYNRMEQELSTMTDLLRLGEFQQSKTLGYISRLFELNPTKAIDLCVDVATICPQDIIFFCNLYLLPVETYFYKFMKARVTDSSEHSFYDNEMVVKKWLEILLQTANHKEKVMDENCNPRSMSHCLKWNDQDIIDHVISVTNENLIQHHLNLCSQEGYWNGLLVLLKHKERLEEMLMLILYLNDVKLLDNNQPNGILPSSVEDWKWFLSQYSSLNHQNTAATDTDQSNDQLVSWSEGGDDHCIPQCPPITWNAIGQLMLQNLGPVTTVHVIKDCNMTDQMFSLPFFQSCVLSSFIHRQQRNVTHSLLEKLDSYLWTKKPNTLMPELQFLVNSQKEGIAEDVKVEEQDSMLYMTSDHSLTSRRYREDMESHWGTSTKINRNCRNCNIQLTETVSHVEPGVLIFPCGHGFHKFCCPLRECIICLELE
ncbi:BLOC-2 complex member HPS5-like isoform X2 [Mytilus californianus]|uniref:BLOC-2 complex member HPS5-like isoform X2 n=1 Tax=Mytilus californianus TaxID=6549 RepID=UPI0022456B27|nr:BLOC-2 complex member HPS5-like isoform X2 [Mytilus californianus]